MKTIKETNHLKCKCKDKANCRCYFTEENIQYYLNIARERFIKQKYESKQ